MSRDARLRAVSDSESSGSCSDSSESDDDDLALATDAATAATLPPHLFRLHQQHGSRRQHLFNALAATLLLLASCVVWVESARPITVDAPRGVLPPFLRNQLMWAALLNTAFMYVAVVIAKRRSSLLRGRHGGYRDIVIVNLLAPLLYVMGIGQYQSVLEVHSPHVLAFLLSFMVGLHMSLIARGPCASCARSLSTRELEHCRVTDIVSYTGKFLYMVALAVGHVMHLSSTGRLPLYLPSYALCAAALLWVSHAVRDTHYLHLHHWAAGILLTPLCHVGLPLVSLLNLGFCAAQFVEGASKWSAAPLWHARW